MLHSVILATSLVALAAPTAGVPDVRGNVERGLKWLAEQQQPDGYWVGQRTSPKTVPTAYAGLALLMEGSTLQHGPYAPRIRKAAEWFESVAQADGALVPTNDGQERAQPMLGHSAGLLFLASAYDTDEDPARRARLKKRLDAAVGYCVKAQAPSGGWGPQPLAAARDNSGTRSTAHVLQSLHAARRAGIDVPRNVTDGAKKYLDACTNPEGGLLTSARIRPRETGGDGRAAETAAAVAAVLCVLDEKPLALPEWVAFTRRNLPFLPSEEVPRSLVRLDAATLQHHLHVALVANSLGEDGHKSLDASARGTELLRWSEQRRRLYGVLRGAQGEDGSWPDPNNGPAQSSALALIILQLDNNYLPAFSR